MVHLVPEIGFGFIFISMSICFSVENIHKLKWNALHFVALNWRRNIIYQPTTITINTHTKKPMYFPMLICCCCWCCCFILVLFICCVLCIINFVNWNIYFRLTAILTNIENAALARLVHLSCDMKSRFQKRERKNMMQMYWCRNDWIVSIRQMWTTHTVPQYRIFNSHVLMPTDMAKKKARKSERMNEKRREGEKIINK